VFKSVLSYSIVILLISCSSTACNNEKFKPKQTVEAVEAPEEKVLTIAEEQEQELIGAAQLDYSDLDESGNGIYGRQLSESFYQKLEVIKSEADPSLKGVLKVICCIDRSGSIMMARPDIQNTTMENMDLQRKVGAMLIDERFEATTTGPERQCGVVVVEF